MVKKVNHSELKEIIGRYYNSTESISGKKIPLIVYGTFGIGKSACILEKSKDIAKEKGKKFAEWNRLSKEQKEIIYKDPSKYFVLIDIRLSEFDSSDVKGLPDYKDKESIEWKVPFWAKFMEKPNSDGILFFDEMNLALPVVISSIYKILHDRIVNEGKIADDWLIIGAGNLESDKAFTNELAPPVRDRAGEVELLPSADSWINWAIQKGEIDSRIIGFIQYKKSNLHKVDFDDQQKFTTERGWARLNTLIKGEQEIEKLSLICGTAISEGIALEFVSFCKIKDKIRIEDIIANPSKIKAIGKDELDIKYFVISALSEKYKDKEVNFKKLLEISEALDENKDVELTVLLWRLAYKYGGERFYNDFSKEANSKIISKYSKFLIN